VGNGKITGPVLDYGPLGNILVGDSGGALHSVSATGTTVTSVTNLGTIADSPIVDPSTNHVFVFSGGNGSAAQVTQYDTTTPLGNARPVSLGGSSSLTGSQLHDGIFDNNYYVNSASAGHLYVCGERSGTVAAPTLYDIGFSSTGVMNLTTSNSLNLTSNTTAGQCSPLTEIYNPNQGSGIDWLFVGVPASCAFGGSSTGCIMALQIGAGTTETFPTSATTAAENGGTSGIIVDNVSTQAGASSIYFTTLTAPGAGGCTPSEPSSDNTTCVVKRTQNGLQ
jgi:hypothetical protein